MSQYPYTPNPYLPPTADYSPGTGWSPRDRSALVAGVMQLVMGALILLAGACIGLTVWVWGLDAVLSQSQASGMQFPDMPPMAVLRAEMIFMFCVMVVVGTSLIALTPFVFRRRRTPILVSMGIVGVLSLLLLLAVGVALMQMGLDPTVIFYIAVLIYFISTLVTQYRALQSVPNPRTVAAMHQAWYYWMQNQQQSGGYGYGYGYDQNQSGSGYPPAQPPPPPQPPADSAQLPPPPSV